jgi:hypothetical protein
VQKNIINEKAEKRLSVEEISVAPFGQLKSFAT